MNMKALKPILILCVAALCFATSCKKAVDMTLVQKTILENADIRQIVASDAWQVTITADSNTYVELQYSAYLEPNLKTRMEGTKLEIGIVGNVYPAINSEFRAIVHTPHLDQLEADDAAQVQCYGSFTSPSFKVSLNDAAKCNGLVVAGTTSEIEIGGASIMTGFRFAGGTCKAKLDDASQFNGQIEANDQLEIEMNNASRFVNKGSATAYASIKLEDASHLNMAETQAANMHVELTSASEATIHVTEVVEGWVKTGSSLYYKGQPQLQVECDGSSTITPF